MLHPGPARSGLPPANAQQIHFAPDATAIPQLTGWWIPAAADAPYRRFTLLYLRGADGSLSDDAATLNSLHAAGLNVLAFSYRGYPVTAGRHPTAEQMTEDTDAAWQYLNTNMHFRPQSIVLYGVGVGCSLAVHVSVQHQGIPALILDQPRGDLLDLARSSPQGYLLPVRLLFHQRFPLAVPLSTLVTPKLILSRGSTEASTLRQAAANPKFTVDLPPGSSAAAFQSTLRRFLDQYLPAAALPEIKPSSESVERLPREPLK